MTSFFEAFDPGTRHAREQKDLDKVLVVQAKRGGSRWTWTPGGSCWSGTASGWPPMPRRCVGPRQPTCPGPVR